MLTAAAAGDPPRADGSVTVLPRAAGGAKAGVVGFTAHNVVAADVARLAGLLDTLATNVSPPA